MFYIIDYHNLCCGEEGKICYLKIFIYQLGLASGCTAPFMYLCTG